jgi:hypothetical protein
MAHWHGGAIINGSLCTRAGMQSPPALGCILCRPTNLHMSPVSCIDASQSTARRPPHTAILLTKLERDAETCAHATLHRCSKRVDADAHAAARAQARSAATRR